MISERCVSEYCYEDPSLIENYEKAMNDKTQVWHCHHRVETIMNCSAEELIAKGCYKDRPAHDLIFLTKAEHHSLHNAGKNNSFFGKKHSEEARAKMRKPKSAETRAKMHASRIGKHFWNNGIECRFCKECPGEGWTRGRLKL